MGEYTPRTSGALVELDDEDGNDEQGNCERCGGCGWVWRMRGSGADDVCCPACGGGGHY